MNRELQLRIASSIVLAAAVLVATWYGGVVFHLLSSLIALLIYHEWSIITGLPAKDFRGYAFGWLAQAAMAANTVAGSADYAIPLLGSFTLTTILLAAARKGSWWLAGGVLYAGLAGISLAAIRADDGRGLLAMLFVFAVVWATDTFAYFVGRTVGGPKLAPGISPGKTWSGAIGGTFAGVAAGMAVTLAYFSSAGLWIAFIALALSVAGQIGDLFESFVKRRFGVKDSSRLIPGHGGVMDRMDGLVFACFSAFLLAVGHSAANSGVLTSVGAFLLGL